MTNSRTKKTAARKASPRKLVAVSPPAPKPRTPRLPKIPADAVGRQHFIRFSVKRHPLNTDMTPSTDEQWAVMSEIVKGLRAAGHDELKVVRLGDVEVQV